MSNKEKAHDKFWYDLINASKEASETVGTMHVLYMGMEYFASECKTCAPNNEEAREMMLGIIDRVLEADDGEDKKIETPQVEISLESDNNQNGRYNQYGIVITEDEGTTYISEFDSAKSAGEYAKYMLDFIPSKNIRIHQFTTVSRLNDKGDAYVMDEEFHGKREADDE